MIITIDYYYGFEIRGTPKGIFVSGRNDSRCGDSLQFNTVNEALTWIMKTVGLGLI